MKVPTIGEFQQLLAVIPLTAPFGRRARAIIVLLVNTGLRIGELCGLDVRHVMWQGVVRPFLEVPKAWAKGSHARSVPLRSLWRRKGR